MDSQALDVLTVLKRPNATADSKLFHLNELKSAIKQSRVPPTAQAAVFECVRTAIGSQTATQLVQLGFSTLSHLLKRLSLQQDDAAISGYSPKLLPTLIDRLGDGREALRAVAAQSLSDIWPFAPAEVERLLRDSTFQSHNTRAKEAGMVWIVTMHQNQGMPFRTYLPLIVSLLEDADNQLRETAKASIVSLFANVTSRRAMVDLKKQLTAFDVRKSTVNYIFSQIEDVPFESVTDAAPNAALPPALVSSFQSSMDVPTPSEPTGSSSASIDPLYFHSQSEFDQLVRTIAPCFAGKESNDNWEPRDKAVIKFRRAVKGNAPTDFSESFMQGVKALMDGFIKAAESLRTTVATSGCLLIQDLFRLLGPAMDNHSEIALQTFIKLAASTKRINSLNGNETVTIVFQTISYAQRSLQHVMLAATDKNVLLRTYAPGWLQTIISKHRGHRSMISNSGGVELVQKSLIKGLTDPNPKVRESSRETYKSVISVWPEMAEPVLKVVPPRDRQILENMSGFAAGKSQTSSANSVASQRSKPTLREVIAAQKRSLAAKRSDASLDRPSSVQSLTSPTQVKVRPQSSLSVSRAAPVLPSVASSHSLLTASSSNSTLGFGPGTLMSGAARRPRRAEPPRPATTEPPVTHGPTRVLPAESPVYSPVIAPSIPQPAMVEDVVGSGSEAVERRSFREASPPTAVQESRDVSAEREPPPQSPLLMGLNNPELVSIDQMDIDHHSQDDDPPSPTPARRASVQIQAEGLHHPDSPPSSLRNALSTAKDNTAEQQLEPVHPPSPSLSPSPSPSPAPSPAVDGAVEEVDGEPISTVPLDHEPVEDEAEAEEPAGEAMDIVQESPKKAAPPSPAFQRERERISWSKENESPAKMTDTIEMDNPFQVASKQTPSQNAENRTPLSGPGRKGMRPLNLLVANSANGMDANRTRNLLATAIERLHSRTLDPHGLRRIQDILRSPVAADVFNAHPRLTADLLLSLLDLLEAPSESTFANKPATRSKVSSLKSQTLSTLRVLVTVRQKDVLAAAIHDTPMSGNVDFKQNAGQSSPLWVAALASVIRARREFPETDHLASEMQRFSNDICAVAPVDQMGDAISTIVGVLEGISIPYPLVDAKEESEDVEGDCRVSMVGIRLLRNLVSRVPMMGQDSLDPIPNLARLGQLVVTLLNSPDPDVRCEVLEFCLSFHQRLSSSPSSTDVGGSKGALSPGRDDPNGSGLTVVPGGPDFSSSPFWKVVSGAREQHLNLITYYIARNGVAS